MEKVGKQLLNSTPTFPHCLTLPLLKCIHVPLHYRLMACLFAPLSHCTAISLQRCLTAPLPHCNAVSLQHCLTALMFQLPLSHCTAVPLHHCRTVPLHHCDSQLPQCTIVSLPQRLLQRTAPPCLTVSVTTIASFPSLFLCPMSHCPVNSWSKFLTRIFANETEASVNHHRNNLKQKMLLRSHPKVFN
jgi:hypothetical protein